MRIEKYVDSLETLKGKTILLTGGTSGIGLEYAFYALKKEAYLVLLSISKEEGEKTKKLLLEKYPNSVISVIEYDQSDYKSINTAVKTINDKFPTFDILVADAGVLATKKGLYTPQGHTKTIGVNYFGTKKLIESLAEINNFPHRFIIQGSIVAFDKLKKDIDINSYNHTFFKKYNISKVLLESQFYEWVITNKYPHIEFILTEPGVTSTNVIRDFNPIIRFLGKWFLKLVVHSPKKACLPLLVGSTSKAKNGDYIVPRGLFTLSGYPKFKKFPIRRYQKEVLDNSKKL